MSDGILSGVDRAATVFAAAGAATALFFSSGEFSPPSAAVGGALLVLVLAFHQPAKDPAPLRVWMLRAAFGVSAGLCCMLIGGWVSSLFDVTADEYLTTARATLVFLVTAVLGTAIESIWASALSATKS